MFDLSEAREARAGVIFLGWIGLPFAALQDFARSLKMEVEVWTRIRCRVRIEDPPLNANDRQGPLA